MKTKHEIFAEMQAILDKAQDEGRQSMTPAEVAAYEKLDGELRFAMAQETQDELSRPRRDARMLPGFNPASVTTGLALTRSQKLADHAKLTREQRQLSLGKYLKGIATGDWKEAEEERAMSIGTGSAGGYLVPTPLSANVLDLARNKARVMQAGALTIPMENPTLKIAKKLTDPTAAWHAEAGTITPSDGTLGVVTLTAKTLTAIVKFSRELWEDVELDAILTEMLSSSFALEIDRAALYGSGVDPEPSGLIDQMSDASQATVSMGTNGDTIGNKGFYDPVIDAIYAVESANYEPNAMIIAPRTQRDFSKLRDDDNNPLQVPAAVTALQRLVTKQVPITRTQGTASNASDIFVGQWDQLLIGMRLSFHVGLLDQLYAGTGQYGLWAWLRCDIQPAHIAAFSAVVGVLPTP